MGVDQGNRIGCVSGVTSSPNVIRVRLFAAARAAAGGQGDVEVSAGSLTEVVEALGALYGPALASVLERSSFLADDVAVSRRDRDTPLSGGTTIDVLPPFAGG